MSDWPVPSSDGIVKPTHISSWSNLMSGLSLFGQASIQAASTAWTTANLADYIPLWLPWPYYVARVYWFNGSSAGGNSDIGIYSQSGVRLFSTGSTSCVTNGIAQYSACGLLLSAGAYYLGYTHSATTSNHIYGGAATANHLRAAGVYQQATALPLPSSATFAAASVAIYPLVGITRMASGF